jgi:hypothetical protein
MWLSKIGARFAQFIRAGYPDTFPRRGFIAAAALLPQRVADGDDQLGRGGYVPH